MPAVVPTVEVNPAARTKASPMIAPPCREPSWGWLLASAEFGDEIAVSKESFPRSPHAWSDFVSEVAETKVADPPLLGPLQIRTATEKRWNSRLRQKGWWKRTRKKDLADEDGGSRRHMSG